MVQFLYVGLTIWRENFFYQIKKKKQKKTFYTHAFQFLLFLVV